jgi:tryptophan halogenase
MKRLAVIGRGTAGALAASHFARWTDWAIDWYFDPQISPQAVGEGGPIALGYMLSYGHEFEHFDLSKIDGHYKTGIHKTGWSDGKAFTHTFAPPLISYHFNAIALQNHILSLLRKHPRVRIIEKNVSAFTVDADYVMDCSGRPDSYEDFYLPESIPVNSVYVTQCPWDYPKFDHTLAAARPHGWVFGIPLRNRCSVGYMYNSEMSSLDEVKEDVKNIFIEQGLTPSDQTNAFSFKNYFRKHNYVDSRIAYNGNASFFLEPMEATSISLMDMINRQAYGMWTEGYSNQHTNNLYLKRVYEIENMIMMHYYAGSVFKSKFWEFAKARALPIMERSVRDKEFMSWIDTSKTYVYGDDPNTGGNTPDHYGTWWVGSFKQNCLALGLYEKLDNLRSSI